MDQNQFQFKDNNQLDNLNKLEELIDELSNTRLINNLHILIPKILDIINNFEFKLKGIQLINKLIIKLDHQNFSKQGYDNLIIFTIKNQFYHQESEIYKILFDVCENALIKFNFHSVNSTKLVTELDEIFDIVLSVIEIGTDDNIILICLENLPKLIKLLDKSIYKHLNRLIDDFIYIVDPIYLEVRFKKIELFLLILKQIINLTNEKLDESKLITILIKLLFTINELNSTEFKTIHQETLNCLKLFFKFNSTSCKFYLNELEQNKDLDCIYKSIRNDLICIENCDN